MDRIPELLGEMERLGGQATGAAPARREALVRSSGMPAYSAGTRFARSIQSRQIRAPW